MLKKIRIKTGRVFLSSIAFGLVISLFFISGITALASTTGLHDSQTAHTDWNSAYYSFVMEGGYLNSGEQYFLQGMSAEPIVFSLHDMDGDGVPELIISNGNASMAGATSYVYAYRDGYVVYLGYAGHRAGVFKYASGSGFPGLYCWDGNMDNYRGYYYFLDANGFHTEYVLLEVHKYNPNEPLVESLNPLVEETMMTQNEELYYACKSADTLLEKYNLTEIQAMTWNEFVRRGLVSDNTLFVDVNLGDWFFSSVKAAKKYDYMRGTSKTSFEPNALLSRAQLATVLYRLEGSPVVTSSNPFTDLSEDWYIDAVVWAAENGIVQGIGNNQFSPSSNITREQLATMMHRYVTSNSNTTKSENGIAAFTDASSISPWAIDSMNWAISTGLVSGMGDGTLAPQGNATRAQCATILMRFYDMID